MTSKKAWTISVSASVLLVVLVFVGLLGGGYRFFVVKTPSMATTAPVGTLVAVHPEASYAIGDIISFERSDRSYTHRIVAQTAQGWVTKGDLNGSPDPLPVTSSQILGKVVFIGKYLGFLVDALPWILVGCAFVYAVTLLPRVRPSWRWQIRLVGWSLVTSIVALWQHPWVNMVMLGYVPDDNVGVDMHLVNSGIFPVRVLGTVLQSGQDAVVNQTIADAGGHYTVTPQLALNLAWFLALLFICLAPTIVSLLIPVEDPSPVAAAEAQEVSEDEPKLVPTRLRRLVLAEAFVPALVVIAAIIAVSMVLQAGTQSAYATSIKNSTDTAGTRTWFTCQNAETGTATPRFVWSLSAVGDQTDLAGSNKGTVYGTAPTANTTSSPCPRDTAHSSLNFNGATCITQKTAVTGTDVYSLEIWFNTLTKANGKLIGFGDDLQVNDAKWDRHIYIDASGRVEFGAWPFAEKVIASPAGKNYADGAWHHVIATSAASGVISLYIDGALVNSRSDAAGQEAYTGYWKVGCGNLYSWQDGSGTEQYAWPNYYTGQLRFAAVYTTTLTAAQVLEHYQAGTA